MRPASRSWVATFSALSVGIAVFQSNAATQAPHEITISVPGIPGPYCMYGIEKRLEQMPEVAGVRLLWDEDAIWVDLKPGATVTREVIEGAIERAEYPYEYSIEL